jgi:hypothetical protein
VIVIDKAMPCIINIAPDGAEIFMPETKKLRNYYPGALSEHNLLFSVFDTKEHILSDLISGMLCSIYQRYLLFEAPKHRGELGEARAIHN